MENGQTGSLRLKYRLLGDTFAPSRIRVAVPGWGGEPVRAEAGARPQPWHCLPFVEGSRYGFELSYSLDAECRVCWRDGKLYFDGDFTSHRRERTVWPPFLSTNPGHYSLGTFVDIAAPDGWVLRTEPHPRFFTDQSGEVPAAVIGNLESSWWPMFFFVTFKSPLKDQVHVFRRGEPYVQLIAVPRTPGCSLEPMTPEESKDRERLAQSIMRSRKTIARRSWQSQDGLEFDDLYKQLHGRHSRSEGSARGTAAEERQETPIAAAEPEAKPVCPMTGR